MSKPLMLRVLDILFSKSDLNISEIYIEHNLYIKGFIFKRYDYS